MSLPDLRNLVEIGRKMQGIRHVPEDGSRVLNLAYSIDSDGKAALLEKHFFKQIEYHPELEEAKSLFRTRADRVRVGHTIYFKSHELASLVSKKEYEEYYMGSAGRDGNVPILSVTYLEARV